jgi:hypothetical protein
MGWFLDTLIGYVMTHVVDVEFRRLKELLGKPGGVLLRDNGRRFGEGLQTLLFAYLVRIILRIFMR